MDKKGPKLKQNCTDFKLKKRPRIKRNWTDGEPKH